MVGSVSGCAAGWFFGDFDNWKFYRIWQRQRFGECVDVLGTKLHWFFPKISINFPPPKFMQFMRLLANAIAASINWGQLIEKFPLPQMCRKGKAFVLHRILSPRSHCQRRRWLLLLLSIFLIAAQRTKQRAAAAVVGGGLWAFQVISIPPAPLAKSFIEPPCANARNMVRTDDLCSPNSVATCHMKVVFPLRETLFANWTRLARLTLLTNWFALCRVLNNLQFILQHFVHFLSTKK